MNPDISIQIKRSRIAILSLVPFTCAFGQDADLPASDGSQDEAEIVVIDGTSQPDASQEVGVLDYSDEELDYSDEDLDAEYQDPQSQREADEEELQRTFALYRESIANRQYDEADTLAKRLIEMAIRLHGLDSHESARALTNLGIVQFRNEDFDSAVLNYEAAIDIIERIEDRLNAGLVNPLKGLGAAHLATGRPDLAKETFDRAVHISHVNDGPHNLGQVEILEALSETYISVGEMDEALDMQEYIYNLQTRKIEEDSDAMIAALERQAKWLHRLHYYHRERLTWRKLIRVIENLYGRDDLALIDPLLGLGKSYLYVDMTEVDSGAYTPANTGETYLKRAIRITEENEESTWEIQEKALLSLGDYYTLSGRPNRAKRTYEEVWALLSEEQPRLRRRYEELESVNILQANKPPKYYNAEIVKSGNQEPGEFETGTVVVGYGVSAYGATVNITVLEANPPDLPDMQRAVAREVRHMIMRPRMVDGTNVMTNNQTYTHEYYYRLSDIITEDPDSPDEQLAPGESTESGVR